MAQCIACEMEMEDGQACTCNAKVCHFCCECEPNCSCACATKE